MDLRVNIRSVEHLLNIFFIKLDSPAIETLHLSVCTVAKGKVEISQNFLAFSEYTNFTLSEYLSNVLITGESNFDKRNVQEMFN